MLLLDTYGDTPIFPPGTALLPSVRPFSDLDTGMWWPAADTLAWSTGGVERLRIDSAGLSTFTGSLQIAGGQKIYLNGALGSTDVNWYIGKNESTHDIEVHGTDTVGTRAFIIYGGAGATEKFRVQLGDAGNFGLGVTAWGTSAAKVLGIGAGTAPSTSPADMAQAWVADRNGVAGQAALHFRDETGLVIQFGNSIAAAGLQLPHVVNKAASANVRNSHDAEATTVATSYTKLKTITITNGLVGAARFLFDLKTAGGGATATARIYRNGVALGTEQTDVTGGYVTKSEDLTQTWNPGDTAEIYAKTSDGAQAAYVQNFRIAYDDSATVQVASVNS
ncbi:MAG: hypothetical protein Q7O66_17440 [Dehalococcoidia bacterium]|nr:hypothetical protein [Dehalococcoidia bacterium]